MKNSVLIGISAHHQSFFLMKCYTVLQRFMRAWICYKLIRLVPVTRLVVAWSMSSLECELLSKSSEAEGRAGSLARATAERSQWQSGVWTQGGGEECRPSPPPRVQTPLGLRPRSTGARSKLILVAGTRLVFSRFKAFALAWAPEHNFAPCYDLALLSDTSSRNSSTKAKWRILCRIT